MRLVSVSAWEFMSRVEMFDNEVMISPHNLDECFSSVSDRVPDHVGRPRDRKSASRIDTAISGNAGLQIKIVVLQGIMRMRRVTHHIVLAAQDQGTPGARTSDRALQRPVL